MKIGIIQASSQKNKNKVIERCLREVVEGAHEIVNFGMDEDSTEELSYVQIALCVCLLLESKAVDFVLTGCTSGQGMMLACNSFSGVLCGYAENATDAYLFGQINKGNALSYPLGVSWGWAAEIQLKDTLRALFCESLEAYDLEKDIAKKEHDTEKLKRIHAVCKRSITDILPQLDQEIVQKALQYEKVYSFVMTHGTNEALKQCMQKCRKG